MQTPIGLLATLTLPTTPPVLPQTKFSSPPRRNLVDPSCSDDKALANLGLAFVALCGKTFVSP
jgi:hypothetical protein